MSNGLYWQPNVDSASEGNFTIDPGDVWHLLEVERSFFILFWFTNYEHIKLASPQAAHQSLHLCLDNQKRCISARDLFKDTPQTDRDRKEREEKRKKPNIKRDSNPVFWLVGRQFIAVRQLQPRPRYTVGSLNNGTYWSSKIKTDQSRNWSVAINLF